MAKSKSLIYKAILVEANRYAAELSRYIHLNPVRAGIADTPEGYL
jgi:putative transposase